ncbi:unnamed protein product [Sphenostylis stenocarpa]|uniref:Uncharacterized protein n=1 Tax=Sphenostylis stenocarpa TaxID=92480 RepID=A0AA86VSH8_9FABA|nr:unnamed protein product [Sphenostylis stenocarpa]
MWRSHLGRKEESLVAWMELKRTQLYTALAGTGHHGLHGPMDKALVYGTRDSGFDPQKNTGGNS